MVYFCDNCGERYTINYRSCPKCKSGRLLEYVEIKRKSKLVTVLEYLVSLSLLAYAVYCLVAFM